MGGYGSTRWGWHTKKNTVEDCLILKAQDFGDIIKRGGPGSYQSITWSRTFVGLHVGEYEEGRGQDARLVYKLGQGENVRALDYHVRMVKTVLPSGGVRWFFLCPLVVNGKPCLRRSSKLYLPPGGLYFGCRECYGLTYTSCQESHKFDGLYKVLAANVGRGVTPRDVKAILNTRKT